MHSTEAIVLRSIDYGESDRIVTLLTPDLGKIGAFAAGARKSRKRFTAALDTGGKIRVRLSTRKGQLWRLNEANVDNPSSALFSNLLAMSAVGALLEAVREGTLAAQPDAHLFDEVCAALDMLSATSRAGMAAMLLTTQLRVLAVLGFAPRLDACVGCQKKPEAEQSALFSPELGAIRCRGCGGGTLTLSATSRSFLLRSLYARSLGDLSLYNEAHELSAQQWTESRKMLEAFTEAKLEKPLQGLKLFARLAFRVQINPVVDAQECVEHATDIDAVA